MASVVLSFSTPPNADDATSPGNVLYVQVGPKTKAKSDAYFLEHILPATVPFIRSHLLTSVSNTISIFEEHGNDLGTRLDLSVGIALVVIQLLFNDSGEWLGGADRPQGKL